MKYYQKINLLCKDPNGYESNNNGECSVKCGSTEHKEGNTCVSNSKDCSVQNGVGKQTWNGGWSSCTNITCNGGYEIINGACVLSVVCGSTERKEGNTCITVKPNDCAVLNGVGKQTWNGSDWGNCEIVSCNSGYENKNGSCEIICGSTEHKEGNICMPNSKDCGIQNGAGKQAWNGSDWGNCEIVSCNAGYENKNGSCTLSFPASCNNSQAISYSQAQTYKATIRSNIGNYIGCQINDYPGSSVYIAGLTNGNNDILVVEKSDISSKLWGCGGMYISTSSTDGMANTNNIISQCSIGGIAARVCRDKGSNWYLPAKEELNTIYNSRGSLGTFGSSNWSSTQYDSINARRIIFSSGTWYGHDKDKPRYSVRCSSRY